MAHHEVTDVVTEAAGACGHGGDDPACKCWGVYTTKLDGTGGQWCRVSSESATSSYVTAYGYAVQQRQMYRDWSYRVRRSSGSLATPSSPFCHSCGASPCDCEQLIWSWRFRRDNHVAWRGGHDVPRGERRSVIAHLHADASPFGIERGPIQRITEPPYEFPAQPKYKSLQGDCAFCGTRGAPEDICCDELRKWRMNAGSATVRCRHDAGDPSCMCWEAWFTTPPMKDRSFTGRNFAQARNFVMSRSAKRVIRERPDIRVDMIVDPPNAPDTLYLVTRRDAATSTPANQAKRPVTTHKCALAWCNGTARPTAMYCSDRCCDYADKQSKLVARMTDFERRTESRRGGAQLWAELAWARARTGHEIVALERSWHAVQHESAVGDERFFKLLDDEGV